MPVGTRGTYHIISRCTRRAFLMGRKYEHRRDWVAELLNELLGGFAVDLHAYTIMSNHFHLVMRPRPDKVEGWSDERVARTGLRHIPVRGGYGAEPMPVTADLVRRYAGNAAWLAEHRVRLSSITWLMKLLKQRISRRANAEDGCTGHFWDSRFPSVPLLHNGAVVSCMAYVDLNPIRARMVKDPASARYTSIAHRLARAGRNRLGREFTKADRALGRRLTALKNCAPVDSMTGELSSNGLDLDDYLCLLQPRRKEGRSPEGVFAKLGVNLKAWVERYMQKGLFQGVAVGNREHRDRFARSQGKKTLADKTRIWDEK